MALHLPEPAPPQPGGPLPQQLQPPADENAGGDSQLQCLQDIMDDFPRLLTELQDPQDVEQAVAALKVLATIQRRLMSSGGAGAQG